jgi:mitogen-activated protein kinase kinase kinase 9
LRCREEELTRARLEQRLIAQHLHQKEKELEAKEMELVQRELHMMLQQQIPTPKRRLGKFKRSRLRFLKKEPGQNISSPSGILD